MKIPIMLSVALLFGRVFPTVLGDAAAAMAPGTWKDLQTTGFTGSLLDAGGGQNILQWTDEAEWNPATQEFLFFGHGHYAAKKFIVYSAATNTWRQEPEPPWGGIGHAYDHASIDPARGLYFFRPYGNTTTYQYDIAQKKWTSLPIMPNGTCCIGMDYFSDMKGLVAAGDGAIHFFSDSTRIWRLIKSGLAMSSYCNFTEYSPQAKTVIFGGWGTELHKLTADGQVTTLKTPPTSMDGCGESIVTTDPVTGRFLVFNDNKFFEYDVTRDAWAVQSGPTPYVYTHPYPTTSFMHTAAAAVSTYGVVMFISFNYSNSKVYLYKHSAMGTRSELGIAAGPRAVRLFPNPVRRGEAFRVDAAGAQRVLLHDLRGRPIRPEGWSSLASGIYAVKAHFEKGTTVKKFIVQ